MTTVPAFGQKNFCVLTEIVEMKILIKNCTTQYLNYIVTPLLWQKD